MFFCTHLGLLNSLISKAPYKSIIIIRANVIYSTGVAQCLIMMGVLCVAGHGCKVNAVYKVSRPGESAGLKELDMGNHRLLWHGTSMANLVSILTRGLLVSPPHAPKSGNLFGEVGPARLPAETRHLLLFLMFLWHLFPLLFLLKYSSAGSYQVVSVASSIT